MPITVRDSYKILGENVLKISFSKEFCGQLFCTANNLF